MYYDTYSINNIRQEIHPTAANTKNKFLQTHKPPTNPLLASPPIV